MLKSSLIVFLIGLKNLFKIYIFSKNMSKFEKIGNF